MKKLYALLFCSCLVFSCSVETEEKKGPSGSWWVGGADGGVFVDIRDDENPHDDRYIGTVYYEHDQSVWYSGEFLLEGKIEGFTPANRSLYEGWDGDSLHLVGEAYLKATGPIAPR